MKSYTEQAKEHEKEYLILNKDNKLYYRFALNRILEQWKDFLNTLNNIVWHNGKSSRITNNMYIKKVIKDMQKAIKILENIK